MLGIKLSTEWTQITVNCVVLAEGRARRSMQKEMTAIVWSVIISVCLFARSFPVETEREGRRGEGPVVVEALQQVVQFVLDDQQKLLCYCVC